MIDNHLPILQVLLPLVAAVLCLLLRNRLIVTTLAIVVTWVTFAVSVALMSAVLRQGVISYELGGWPPPFGIEYRVDVLNAFVLVLVSGIGAVVATWSPSSISVELPRYERNYLFYCA